MTGISWGHRVFLVSADYLTRQGIAVLRYNDRGAGRSEGNHDEASFEDFSFIVLMAAPGYNAIDGNETGLNSPFTGLNSQFENGYKNGGASEEAIIFKCMLLSQMFSIAREEPDKNSARKKIGELLKSEEPSLLELSEETIAPEALALISEWIKK